MSFAERSREYVPRLKENSEGGIWVWKSVWEIRGVCATFRHRQNYVRLSPVFHNRKNDMIYCHSLVKVDF
jgi:hypothetical protein